MQVERELSGYSNLVGVTLDLHEAAIRAAIRAKQQGRWVPYARIAEAHLGFNQSIKEYMTHADDAHVYENITEGAPELIAIKAGPKSMIEVANPKLWNKIDDRGRSNESARSHEANQP